MEEFFYETGKLDKDAECGLCDKVGETLRVRCKLGSFDGKLCLKCLARMSKSRNTGAKKPAPANGEPIRIVP